MTDPVRIHIDYGLHPDFRLEECPLAGESLWCEPLGGDLYRVDNLPFTTLDFGYGDTIAAADQGTGWRSREFFYVAKYIECFRFIIAPDDPKALPELAERIKSNWPNTKGEGGFGFYMVQSEPEDGMNIAEWLDTQEIPFMANQFKEPA